MTSLLPKTSEGEYLCPGKNFAKWALTPIGPNPGPPPPWGIAKVLCKFKWQTSAPKYPGEVYPI